MNVSGYGIYRALIIAVDVLLLFDYYQMNKVYITNPSGKQKVFSRVGVLVTIYSCAAIGCAYFLKVNKDITLFWVVLVLIYFSGVCLNAYIVYHRKKWTIK